MTNAYMKWEATQGAFGMEGAPEPVVDPEDVEKEYRVKVINVFGLDSLCPWKPTLAIAARVLKLYRVVRLRCPNLSVQSWVKALSDVQARAFKPYQVQQFTICFDLYLEILRNVDARVKKALAEGETIFEMLHLRWKILNGSEKRAGGFRRERVAKRGGTERPDPRAANAGGDYYLTRERVNKWSKEVLAQQVQVPRSNDPEEDNLCQERWKNMSEEITEACIFLSLCRHGFVLLIADMVRSGELAKYGLAIADTLMDAFGEDTGLGYNIGCGFGTTIRNSPLGPKAKRLNFRMLVGSFHGHAHNRMCQLRYLATYVLGLEIEDLEGCESVYHRKQAITTYAAHVDTFETYTNLSTFLVNNYQQSLAILETENSLQFAMAQAGISGKDEFVRRLEEEKTYLRGLSKEPESETQKMDYYQRLVNLKARKKTFDEVFGEGSKANGIAKRHARENYDKVHNAVQEMEETLQVEARWTADGPEWNAAGLLVVTRRYRLCVNKLEELVLKRLFELTKMNMSQMGYKLRKHIAKALQVQSKTIWAALARYNLAAGSLTPKHQKLTWAEVVEYAFLSDFDILRDPTGNAALRDWATQGGRQLMDSFFRIERAKEEIPQLNIEICRLVTYICDEKIFLLAKEAEIIQMDPHLAYFIRKYRNQRGRSMKKKLGSWFTGTLEPGVRWAEAVEHDVEEEMDVDSDIDEAEAATVEAEIA
ncbi:hypothetical protein B0H17DRAFT_1160032 [Mycena rosella]|uniref:Uncharacterized protein n=1 Tax=Mycena rosella TaxID=1033263 RepID=A0AAD7GDV7_MYCRO|nr:hypothetical protein B0H17DRAFT_1160032 [Mycena rosella]